MSSDCSPGATAFSPRRISLDRHSGARAGANPESRAGHFEIPGSRAIGRRKSADPLASPRNDVRNWTAVHHSATVGMQQPQCILGEFRIMRGAIAIIGLLALGGCAGDVSTIDQPSMYVSMANGGAKLDAQAAASMISLYRSNNVLC